QLAAELAAHLDDQRAPHDLPEDLVEALSLLANLKPFELDAEALSRGRAEIHERIAKSPGGRDHKGATIPFPKWRRLHWLPLPAAAALVLVFWTFRPPDEQSALPHAS